MSSNVLPAARSDQRYVTVSAIPGGFITLPDNFFVHPADPGARRTVPSLAFLITHPGTSTHGSDARRPFRMMFDLGLRKARDRYPPPLQAHIDSRAPHALAPGVAAQLASAGVDPRSDIDVVMLSHVHYDHHGDPEDFPSAKFVVGNGAMDVLAHGLGGIASHQHFDPDTLPAAPRTSELPDPRTSEAWTSLGPFPAAMDWFDDGSVYVIDTPGHLPGHVNLLCRTAERWICLCGDAFHDPRLLTGEKEIGTWEGSRGETLCIHLDKEKAAESIARLREFDRATGDRCELIAAHDDAWWRKNEHRAFPATL